MHALLLSIALLADVLTNADVVKLVEAGLSPATIEAKIAASEAKFDTSTDALVALAKAGVPDAVIKVMITKAPAPAVARSPVPAPAPAPAPRSSAFSRRFDVAIHRDENARCSGAELRVDTNGVKGSRCKGLDFDVAWKYVTSVCHDYGFRGTIVIATAKASHRVSTETPAEAQAIVEAMRKVGARPAECRK